jgi:hypothetical protein
LCVFLSHCRLSLSALCSLLSLYRTISLRLVFSLPQFSLFLTFYPSLSLSLLVQSSLFLTFSLFLALPPPCSLSLSYSAWRLTRPWNTPTLSPVSWLLSSSLLTPTIMHVNTKLQRASHTAACSSHQGERLTETETENQRQRQTGREQLERLYVDEHMCNTQHCHKL